MRASRNTSNHFRVLSREQTRSVVSISDLSLRKNEPRFEPLNEMYEVQRITSVGLTMNDKGWAETLSAMRAPREIVEHQTLVTVRDLYLKHEAIFNPLRKHRASSPPSDDPATLLDQERNANGCRWCSREGWHVQNEGMWSDDFGEVNSDDRRVCARANWARQAPISGIVFGDESMHNYLKLSLDNFISLFDTAERYIRQARQSRSNAVYFMVFMNGGSKSAGTVSHAHLQVIGRENLHFAYPERLAALCPKDYWQKVRAVHEDLGLAIRQGECTAWASLAPVKERDLCVLSPSFHDGAIFLYGLVQTLKARGSNSFSLAAIPSPNYIAGSNVDGRFLSWPNVLWRFVDRGDLRVRHSDYGSMELFASTSVATDPFLVAQWLRGTVTW